MQDLLLLPTAIADLLDILPDAVVAVDARGRVVYTNPAVRNLLGYLREDLIGQPLSLLVPPAARERHEMLVGEYLQSGAPTMMGSRPVLRAMHRSGRLVPVSISLCNLPLSGGDVVSVAVVHDISLLHTHLDRATALAQTDALTGLGNRLMLSRQMQANLENERPFALLLLDLTGFKALNDRHGHAAGDEALRVVGQRLLALVRESDVAARLGGDEFVLLLDGLASLGHLQERARSVSESLSRPLSLNGVQVALGVNIGGAAYPGHGDTESALLGAADRAMYAAKRAGEPYRSAG
ncbi:MAG: diguanylate cyclase [Piscinibacter sp.]